MNKKKILIILDSLESLGGTQNYTRKLKEELEFRNYSCKILSLKPSNTADFSLNLRFNAQIVFYRHKLNKLVSNFDKVFVVSGHIFGYISIALKHDCLIWRESNNPELRNNSKSILRNIFNKLMYNYFLKKNTSSTIILPSNQCKNEKMQTMNVVIIHNFINIFPSKKITDQPNQKFKFIACGRWNNQKGADRLLSIFKDSDFKLDFFGEKSTTVDNKNIVFHGKNKMANIYPNSDCLLLLSRFEGYPNVVNEARASGCSIILSKENSWLREVEIVSKNIIFVGTEFEIRTFIESNDIKAMKNALSKPDIDKYNSSLTDQLELVLK